MLQKFKLVDYLGEHKKKYDPHHELPPQNVIIEHNNNTDADDSRYISSKDGQIEYYRNHKVHGHQFLTAAQDLTDFLIRYPDVPKHLLTTLDGNCDFPTVPLSSDDEKEVHMWKKHYREDDSKYDIEIPFNATTISSNQGLHLVKNANWRELDDPYRQIEDGLSFSVDGMIYSDETQSPMDVLKAYITNSPLVIKSKVESDLSNYCDDGERKVTFSDYPNLHPRVKTYLGLLKKYIGVILKIENVRYNSIDIIPINDDYVSVFISSNDAETINTDFNYFTQDNMKDAEVGYLHDNLLLRISSAYGWLAFQTDGGLIDDDDLTNDNLFFTFYKRDRSLRFQSILSSRIERIRDNISSLNKLHNPTNYKFEEKDFDETFNKIKKSLEKFQKDYKSYFELKEQEKNPISKQDYEKVLKELEEYKKKDKEKKSE